MMYFSLLTLLGLSQVLLPCKGQVISPPDGSSKTVLSGENVNITWLFNVDVSNVVSRIWYFTSSDGSFDRKVLASIGRGGMVFIEQSGLAGVSIVKPTTLLLNNVNQTYNGTYQFDISGSAVRGNFEIVVYIAKTPIVSVNCSVVANLTEGVFFACECKGTDGNPPAVVTWYKDNTLTGVTGKEEAILRFDNINKDNNGTYKCEAKSGIEKAKNETSIELIVNYPPQDTNLTFNYTILTITCEAYGYPPPTFEILYNNHSVSKKNVYMIPGLNDSTTGNYTCVAKNAFGKDSSMPRYIFPIVAPKISVNCSSTITVNQSDYFACECKGIDGKPPANVTWYKDNKLRSSGTEKAVLVLSNVDKDDNGTYRCVAKSEEKSNVTAVILIVSLTPAVTTNCSHVIAVNQSDYLACKCEGTNGNPPAVVTWYKNSEKIVTKKGTVHLPNTQKDNSGTYRCEAKSSEYAKNDTHIEIIVVVKPTIAIDCDVINILNKGQNFTCNCNGTNGNPPAIVTWYKDNKEIKKGEKLSKELILTNVDTEKSGKYTCEAKSYKNAKNKKSIEIIVRGVDADDDAISSAVIAGIIIGVLVFIVIIIVVVYYCKKRERNGYKGNANVNPDEGGVVVNHYELEEDNAYDSIKGDNAGDNNAYSSINPAGSSASTSKPSQDTMPPVYAAVDKNNRDGKTLYATLDSVALESDGSKKPKDDRPPPTEYADINFLKKEPDQNAGEAV